MIAGAILVFLGIAALFAFRVATDPIYLALVLGFLILWMYIKRTGSPASASTGSGTGVSGGSGGGWRRGAAEAVNTAADAAGGFAESVEADTSGSSGPESEEADQAESQVEESEEAVDDVESDVESGQEPDTQELLQAVKNMEKPVKAFELMIQASDKDIQQLLEKARRIEKQKKQENKKIKSMFEKFKQLENQLDSIDSEALNEKLKELDSLFEDIEKHQSEISSELSDEEERLLNDLRQNRRALKDIDEVVKVLAEASRVEERISSAVAHGKEVHDMESLELADQEIQRIESSLEKIISMENDLVEELEKLEQIESETEEVEQQELEEIARILKQDQKLEQKLETAGQNGASTQQTDRIENIAERLEQLLKQLGHEIEEEEDEEEQIQQKAEQGETETATEESQVEQDLDHAEQQEAETSEVTAQAEAEQQKKEWKRILESPSSHIVPKDHLDIEREELVPYIEEGDEFSWSTHPKWNISLEAPRQGFKFHVTARPEEGYEVCQELIPVLQAEKIPHKVIWSKEWMENRIKERGDIQALKLMTIYPEVPENQDSSQKFYVGNDKRNRREFFKNQKNTEKILSYILYAADDSILRGGPQLEGKRDYFNVEFQTKEFRVRETRLFLTYSHLGHPSLQIVKNGNKFNLEDYVLKKDGEGNYIRRDYSPFYELSDQNFRDSGKYRENGKYDSSDYFLSHLLGRNKAREVKKGLGGRFGRNTYQEDAIIGLDGKIAGAHYLPPPEGIQRINEIINDIA